MVEILDRLLASDDPVVRYKALLLQHGPSNEKVRQTRALIYESYYVRTLLSERGPDGKIPHSAYAKWQGAHWVLAILADLGYPPGDRSLIPLREQVFDWLLSEHHFQRIRTISGRTRRCASQEGNALYAMLTLGLADERCDELARRLAAWQWPDGGWNCDKKPEACHSSFNESLIPLRGLSLHAQMTGNEISRQTAQQAAEVFLKRGMFKRLRDGSLIEESFIRLHYPSYWHYDFLTGLKVMAEAGYIQDERCSEALDLLESRRLPDGGFPAEEKFYRVSDQPVRGFTPVDWGGTSKQRMHPFVTLDALFVLRSAGRI